MDPTNTKSTWQEASIKFKHGEGLHSFSYTTTVDTFKK